AGAQVLHERKIVGGRHGALAYELRVRVEHVEEIADQPDARALDVERAREPHVGIPETPQAERVDLRRDKDGELIDAQSGWLNRRERIALPSKPVERELDVGRQDVQQAAVELPAGVQEHVTRTRLRRE